MKETISLSISFLVSTVLASCTSQTSPELARLVNDQNDGFNSFNLVIYVDSTYSKEEWTSSNGRYTLSDSVIFFKTGPLKGQTLAFRTGTADCMCEPKLQEKNWEIAMRVIQDSLFCKELSKRSK